MSNVSKTIDTITMYTGYDQESNLHNPYIYFINGIVVPDDDIANVNISIYVTPYNSADESLSGGGEYVLSDLYFTTDTPANGFAMSNLDTGYQSGSFQGIASLSLFRQNRGKTVYLGGLVSDLYSGDGQLDHFTVSGTIDFTIGQEVISYTFTITPNPSDATVMIDGVSVNTVTLPAGTTVTYTVTKVGYYEGSGSHTITRDETKIVSLVPITPVVTIKPTPLTSTVYMNGSQTTELTVSYGGSVEYEVSHPGYVTETGTISNIRVDQTKNVALTMDETPWTFAIVVTPDTAYVRITTAENGDVEAEGSLTVETYGYQTIEWYAECPGYFPQSGTLTAYEDTTINVNLIEEDENTRYNIKFGSSSISGIKLGSQTILAAYLGGTLLWGTGSDSESTLPEENQKIVTAITGSIGVSITDGSGEIVTMYRGSGTTFIPIGCTNVTISGEANSVSYNSETGEVTYTIYGPEPNKGVMATISWS